MSDVGFLAWVQQAEPGDRLQYHRGFLALDTFALFSGLSDKQRAELGKLAHRAFCAAEQGLVHLVQERIATDRFSYIAIARPNTPKDERDRIIAAFKRGELRALASMGVLTTGFNAPGVDLIAMLRPTKSPGLYVQMAGRGTRLAPGKGNCLVLDFAGNVTRHGPIDLVRPKTPRQGRWRRPDQDLPRV
jgi:superfamily II DNA or RNA helicase